MKTRLLAHSEQSAHCSIAWFVKYHPWPSGHWIDSSLILTHFLTGVPCDIFLMPCDEEPCENGGTCVETGSSYRCDCPEGFTGNQCEMDINECLSEPCDANQICTNVNGGYFCCEMVATSWAMCLVRGQPFGLQWQCARRFPAMTS